MSSPQNAQALQVENEQLKAKYKKALQELMHVLQINKTLKQSASHNSSLEASQREDSENVKKLKEEVRMCRAEMEKNKGRDMEEMNKIGEMRTRITQIQEENLKIKAQLQKERRKSRDTEQQITHLRSQLRSAHQNYQYEISQLKSQSLHLKKAAQKSLNNQQQRQNLQAQLFALKDTLMSVDSQHEEQRQKWRRDKNQLEQYYITLRREDNEKMTNLQAKYSMLESQISQERNLEQFLRNQERQIQAEQIVFQSIRGQIEKINRDWRKIQQQKSEELERIKVEVSNKNKKMAQFQIQNQRYRLEIDRLKKNVTTLEKELKEKSNLKQKISLNQTQKRELLQKNNVLQALTMTQRHRHGIEVSERIEQFQRRVHLLLQEKGKSLEGMAGIQQIIILKSYVRQLSQLLNNYKQRQEKLVKSKSVLKMRQKSLQKEYKGQLKACKKKISDYDTLVGKFYSMLQQKVKQKPNGGHPLPEAHINEVINQYQQKMLQMSEQIILLKRKLSELQQKSKSCDNVRVTLQVDQNQIQHLQEQIKKLQFHIQGLEVQNQNLFNENNQLHQTLNEEKEEAEEIVKQKNQIIQGLTSKNVGLEREVAKVQEANKNLKKLIDSYEKENQSLHIQMAKKSKVKASFDSNLEAPNELVERINDLEEQVQQLTRDKEEFSRQSIDIQKDKEREYQVKFWSQNEEIASCRITIQNLQNELENRKNSRQSQEVIEDLRQQIFNLTSYKQEMEKKLTKLTNIIEDERDKLTGMQERNHDLQSELTHKQAELLSYKAQIKKMRSQGDCAFRSTKEIQIQSEEMNIKTQREKKKEIENLNNIIFSLRTANLGLDSDIKEKEEIISELKQEIFQIKVQQQKQMSNQSVNGSGEIQKLKKTIADYEDQIDSLKNKNQQLQRIHIEKILRDKQSLVKIEERQAQLDNAIQNNTSLDFKMKRSNSPPKSPLLREQPDSPHPDYEMSPGFIDKIEIVPREHFIEEKVKVVQSYDVIPVNEPPAFRPGAKSSISGQPQYNGNNSSFAANFDKKRNQPSRDSGSKRSIKMIKMAAKSSIQVDSPLLWSSMKK